MQAAIDRQSESLWWVHTHPGMGAFFSDTDVGGAHDLWDMVYRPISAVVLGKDATKYEAIIDSNWIEKNLKPKPIQPLWDSSGYWNNRQKMWEYRPQERIDIFSLGQDFWDWFHMEGSVLPPNFWTWGHKRQRKWWVGQKQGQTRKPTLESDIEWILEEYGQTRFLEVLDKMNVIRLIRDLGSSSDAMG